MRYRTHNFAFFILLLILCLAGANRACLAQTPVPTNPILRIETGMHTAAIQSIAVDAANKYLVTGSKDKTVRVWDAATGLLLNVLRPPIGDSSEGSIFAVAISPDGNTIACGGWSGYQWDKSICMYLFDRRTGALIHRIPDFPNSISDIAYSANGRYLAAVTSSGGLRVYRTSDDTEIGRDTTYAGSSYSVAFSPDADTPKLVTSCDDGFLRLYQIHENTETPLTSVLKSKATGGKYPYGVAFSPDGTKIAVGFYDLAKITVLSADDLSVRDTPDTTNITHGNLCMVSWSRDGTSLYAGGTYGLDGVIRKWSQGGAGSFTDLHVAQVTIMSIKPRRDGGMFYCASDPAFGIFDGKDKQVLFHTSEIADFRANQGNFLISPDGQTVRFGYVVFGKSPAAFSVQTRVLTQNPPVPSGLQAAVTTAQGLDVKDWQDTPTPTLNGKPIALDLYEVARSVAIAPDHQSLVLGTEFQIRAYDVNEKLLWQVREPSVTWDVNVSGDGKLAVAALSDGTIRWYRMSDGKELLDFFPDADKKHWVAWTPSGYYDCSPGGEDLIGWHVNNGKDKAADFYPASRFRDTYYRPDVISRVLTTLDEPEALAQANDAAGRKKQDTDIAKKLPPVVTILSPDNATTFSGSSVTVTYALRTPSGEPVTGVRALVDGRPVSATRDLQLVSSNGTTKTITVTVPSQDCQVSVIAENKYAASEAATVRLVWQGAPKPTEFVIKPTLYVLAVGASKYKDTRLTLTYPAKDAADFAHAMEGQKGVLYKDVVVKLLTDAQADRGGILDGLEWLQEQTTSKDVAMLFLSGHGANDSNGKYFFVPDDFDISRVKSTGLPFSEITSTVSAIAGKAVFFVDSCHSGNVMGTTTKALPDVTGIVNELASAENGSVVFSASTGSEVALEDPKWGNGAFTKAVVEGLNGGADYTKTGRITIKMLDLYITERVKALTHGTQHPTTQVPPSVPDFPIAVH